MYFLMRSYSQINMTRNEPRNWTIFSAFFNCMSSTLICKRYLFAVELGVSLMHKSYASWVGRCHTKMVHSLKVILYSFFSY